MRYDARTAGAARSRGRQRRGYPSVAVSSDGRRLVAWARRGHRARREDAACARELPVGGQNGHALSGRPHGRDRARRSVRLLDLRTGAVRTAEGRHGSSIPGPLHAGRPKLVTTGEDGKIALWGRRERREHGETFWGTPGRSSPPSRPTAGRSTPPASTAPWSSGTSPATGASAGRSRRHGQSDRLSRAQLRRPPDRCRPGGRRDQHRRRAHARAA